MTNDIRFLVVSFDGLRPDLISDAQTPNIRRVQRLGSTLARHRTVYPSETRAAFPSLVTGVVPGLHGMVGNKYVDRSVATERYIDTSNATLLAELDRGSGGRLMGVPTLGERLAAAGEQLVVLATNTAGTTRLFHHKAEQFGHFRLSGHFPEAATPPSFLAEVEERYGALPPQPPVGEPDLEAQTLITSCFLELVWPRLKPKVTILSFGEPDTASHYNGTGGQKTREAIAWCDHQLGRLVDWWEAEGRAANVQLVIVSDHGHITGHSKVSVIDRLREAGYAAAAEPGDGVGVVVVPGQVGALYLRDRSEAAIARLASELMHEPWCGPIFTAPRDEVHGIAPSTLSRALVGLDHPRSPEICFSFRADNTVDPFGLRGGTWYDNPRRPGLGVHGGLHPKELAAVGIAAGSLFIKDCVSALPSGICDVVPTILVALDLPATSRTSGRVLDEIMVQGPGVRSAKPVVEAIAGERRTGYTQLLQRSYVGEAIYLDGATIGSSPDESRQMLGEWQATAFP